VYPTAILSVRPSVCHTRVLYRKSYLFYRTVPLSITWSDPESQFQGHGIVYRRISCKRRIQSTPCLVLGWDFRLSLDFHHRGVHALLSHVTLASAGLSCSLPTRDSIYLGLLSRSLSTSWLNITSQPPLYLYRLYRLHDDSLQIYFWTRKGPPSATNVVHVVVSRFRKFPKALSIRNRS